MPKTTEPGQFNIRDHANNLSLIEMNHGEAGIDALNEYVQGNELTEDQEAAIKQINNDILNRRIVNDAKNVYQDWYEKQGLKDGGLVEGYADGGEVCSHCGRKNYEDGGEVEGPGTGTSDSVEARLSDGEFVFTAKAVEQIGADNLMAIMKEAEKQYDKRTSASEARSLFGKMLRK